MYAVKLTKQAMKDRERILAAGLGQKVKGLVRLLGENPFLNPPPYEKLIGDLSGCYSRRINRQHRLVYSVEEESKTVRILRMWTHYE